MSNLLILPGPGEHRSLSQRKIALLEAARDHLVKVIAVLVAQTGGVAVVPKASLAHDYAFSYDFDPVTGDIHYTSTPTFAPSQEEAET